jgi:hypothetical protein
MSPEEELEKQQTALAKLAVSSRLMSDDFNSILVLTEQPQSRERDKKIYAMLERIERTITFIQNTVIEDLFFQDLTPIRD